MTVVAAPFLLSKWYLDCVGDDGRVFIGYAARMRWGPFTLRSMSTLQAPGAGGPVERTALRGFRAPEHHGESLTWQAPRLGVEARWTATQAPLERRLLESQAGSVQWRCRLPCAAARVEVAGSPPFCGLGYVEELELTIKPWRLPIDELRWGRFLAPGAAVIWIEWRGAEPRCLVFDDGDAAPAARIGDGGLAFGGAELELRDGAVLREGSLGAGALKGLGAARWLLPRKLSGAHERKWRSRGLLKRPGRAPSEGWAIHEVVRWS